MSVESIDITISKILHHQPSKWSRSGRHYLIARTDDGRTIKGEMREPVEGEHYRLWGEWRSQKGYVDPAFEFDSHEVIIEETESGIAYYLRNHIHGLGPVKAQALVEEFGSETLTVLRSDPDCALVVPGINEKIVESICEHFSWISHDPVAYAKLADMFAGHKFPRQIIRDILNTWKSDAPAIVREKPYILLKFPRMGWKGVDAFAVTTAGYPKDGIERHKAAILEGMERISSQGHTYGTPIDVEAEVCPLLGGLPDMGAFQSAIADHMIGMEDDTDGLTPIYGLPRIMASERMIAARLAALSQAYQPILWAVDPTGLNPGQRQAMALIRQHSVCIIAGAPGVGKTYIVGRAIKEFVDHGIRSIKAAAPTGKAAKRLGESIRRALAGDITIPSTTIHRLLSPVPSQEPEGVPSSDARVGRGREEYGFYHNEDHPIESQMLVVDETSMLDVSLGASLLRAVARGTRLVFVGDPHQLPSVGPGSVLRDLIAAGVPSVELTEIQRNAGRIVRACHAIKEGQVPQPAERVDLESGENWIHLEISDPGQIASKIVALHESAGRNGRFDPVWDMQVISPEYRKSGVGCNDLNRLLSGFLNLWRKDHPEAVSEDDEPSAAFCIGDKVVRTKNGLCDLMVQVDQAAQRGDFDWEWNHSKWKFIEVPIVNGDMGEVWERVEVRGHPYVVVEFQNPRRWCLLPAGECHLQPAYAITAHKAQGSEFPYVVLPLHHSFYFDQKTGQGLWNREMVYTMFSRAERLLVTVGQFSALIAAIQRKTIHRRRTRLKDLAATHFGPKGQADLFPADEYRRPAYAASAG
jgi:exodeoxyribonuclease V alpha subunit